MPQRHLNLQLKEQKRAHAWHEAIQLLVRARQSRWDPDVIGYTTAIQACDRDAGCNFSCFPVLVHVVLRNPSSEPP